MKRIFAGSLCTTKQKLYVIIFSALIVVALLITSKENLDVFKKSLRKLISKNKRSQFGAFRTIEDEDKIENIGQYINRLPNETLLHVTKK